MSKKKNARAWRLKHHELSDFVLYMHYTVKITPLGVEEMTPWHLTSRYLRAADHQNKCLTRVSLALRETKQRTLPSLDPTHVKEKEKILDIFWYFRDEERRCGRKINSQADHLLRPWPCSGLWPLSPTPFLKDFALGVLPVCSGCIHFLRLVCRFLCW